MEPSGGDANAGCRSSDPGCFQRKESSTGPAGAGGAGARLLQALEACDGGAEGGLEAEEIEARIERTTVVPAALPGDAGDAARQRAAVDQPDAAAGGVEDPRLGADRTAIARHRE